MATRKINLEYLNYYNEVIMEQPLARGYVLLQHLKKKVIEGQDIYWIVSYTTTSPFHICPFDGMQRRCTECPGHEDEKYCMNKIQLLSSRAVCGRVNDCINAGLNVKFIEDEVE